MTLLVGKIEFAPRNPSAVCAWPTCPALPTRGKFCPVHAPRLEEDVTESKRTRLALDEVQRQFPKAVIYKHNDRSTKGIPDVEILLDGIVFWFEMKDADKESVESLMATPRGKLQHHELKRLHTAGAVARIVVFRGKHTELYFAHDLSRCVDYGSLANYIEHVVNY